MEFSNEIGQGTGNYHYQIFRLDSEGKLDVISADSIDFTVTKQNAVTGITKAEMLDYAKRLNEKQEDISTGILSFYQDEAAYYPEVIVKREKYETLCQELDVSAGDSISSNLDRVLAKFPRKNGTVDKEQFMVNGNLYPLKMNRSRDGEYRSGCLDCDDGRDTGTVFTSVWFKGQMGNGFKNKTICFC